MSTHDGATLFDKMNEDSDDVSSRMRRYRHFGYVNPENMNVSSRKPSKFSLFANKHPGIANFITHPKFQNGCLSLAITAGMCLLPIVLICPFTWFPLIAVGVCVLSYFSFLTSGILASELKEINISPKCR